eukprot:UN10797
MSQSVKDNTIGGSIRCNIYQKQYDCNKGKNNDYEANSNAIKRRNELVALCQLLLTNCNDSQDIYNYNDILNAFNDKNTNNETNAPITCLTSTISTNTMANNIRFNNMPNFFAKNGIQMIPNCNTNDNENSKDISKLNPPKKS